MVSRQNIDTLDDLATYLREGVANRQRTLQDTDAAVAPTESAAAELRGEIRAFEKVLQILENQLGAS